MENSSYVRADAKAVKARCQKVVTHLKQIQAQERKALLSEVVDRENKWRRWFGWLGVKPITEIEAPDHMEYWSERLRYDMSLNGRHYNFQHEIAEQLIQMCDAAVDGTVALSRDDMERIY